MKQLKIPYKYRFFLPLENISGDLLSQIENDYKGYNDYIRSIMKIEQKSDINKQIKLQLLRLREERLKSRFPNLYKVKTAIKDFFNAILNYIFY